MEDERDSTPPVEVGSLKRDELRGSVQELSLPVDQLMERVHIHELIVISGPRLNDLRLTVTLHGGLSSCVFGQRNLAKVDGLRLVPDAAHLRDGHRL